MTTSPPNSPIPSAAARHSWSLGTPTRLPPPIRGGRASNLHSPAEPGNEDHKFITLRVLAESGEAEYQKKLSTYTNERRWTEFWDLKQRFHELDYAYSLTIHKCQGSTFQDVFVDMPSMHANHNIVERNQLCYVTFTCAAKRLFFYQLR